mmetsp:Transcript_15004/g.47061  ORF Transcript_15004/g.47061 Transcript_15004/m.47061 type:complete len:235 (-) Transcript_15004:51-755(-)
MARRRSVCSWCHSLSSSSLRLSTVFDSRRRSTSSRFSRWAHSAWRCARRMMPRAWRRRRLASRELRWACRNSISAPSRSMGRPPESIVPALAVSAQRLASRTSARHAPQSSEASEAQPLISTQTWHCVAQDWSRLPHSLRQPVMTGRRCDARAASRPPPAMRLCRRRLGASRPPTGAERARPAAASSARTVSGRMEGGAAIGAPCRGECLASHRASRMPAFEPGLRAELQWPGG